MSMVDRCGNCCELVTRCRCDWSPLVRAERYVDSQRAPLIDPDNPPELRPENRSKWHG